MTPEQQSRYAGLIFRTSFMLKMIDNEIQYYSQFKTAPSGIRNELHRLKTVYGKGIENLKSYMPNSKKQFEEHLNSSEERISAMCNIIEKLAVLPEEDLYKIEDQFNNHVKIQYAK